MSLPATPIETQILSTSKCDEDSHRPLIRQRELDFSFRLGSPQRGESIDDALHRATRRVTFSGSGGAGVERLNPTQLIQETLFVHLATYL